MAGGVWSETDKPVLPGLYLNFKAAAVETLDAGSRGVVAIPVRAHWGPVRQFVEIVSERALIDTFGTDESGGATAYTTVRLALMGGARKVLAYRLADSDAAAASTTLTDTAGTPAIRLDAKYPGERGNNFNVTVRPNPSDSTKKDILLYEGTKLLRTFTFADGSIQVAIDSVNNDPRNVWITATKLGDGNGQLQDVTNQAFSGGNSGIAGVTATDYTDFLAAAEGQLFSHLALDGVTDPAIHAAVKEWVARVRTEGKGVQAVLGGSAADDTAADAVNKAIARSASFDHEGVINVGVGAVKDGVTYSSAQVAAYVAGLESSRALNEATTFAVTPFDDVTRRWTRAEQEEAIKNGVFLLIHDGRRVKVLRGINTLTTVREGQNEAWKKTKTIRVIDAIAEDLTRTTEDSYIGKVPNTEEGRLALIGAYKAYLETLAASSVIDPVFNVYPDPDYHGPDAPNTPQPDEVYIRWEIKLVDVMEKIFGTVIVR